MDPARRHDPERFQTIARIGMSDAMRAFRVDRVPGLGAFCLLPRWSPAKRFAADVLEFDRVMGELGPSGAGQFILDRYAASLQVESASDIPRNGPLLVVSNHPGLTDAMALWTVIDRADLKTLAARRDLVEQIPNTLTRLITLDEGNPGAALRQAVSHLRSGGCLLTFPAGRIEPDPAFRRLEDRSLGSWSASAISLLKLCPGLQVVPAIVSGVLTPRAMRNPVTRLFRNQSDRDWASATLQVMFPKVHGAKVRVRTGRCFLVAKQNRDSATDTWGRVLQEARRLLTQCSNA